MIYIKNQRKLNRRVRKTFKSLNVFFRQNLRLILIILIMVIKMKRRFGFLIPVLLAILSGYLFGEIVYINFRGNNIVMGLSCRIL